MDLYKNQNDNKKSENNEMLEDKTKSPNLSVSNESDKNSSKEENEEIQTIKKIPENED